MDTVKYAYCRTCLDGAEVDITPDGTVRQYGFAAKHWAHDISLFGSGCSETNLRSDPVVRKGTVRIVGLAGRHTR